MLTLFFVRRATHITRLHDTTVPVLITANYKKSTPTKRPRALAPHLRKYSHTQTSRGSPRRFGQSAACP